MPCLVTPSSGYLNWSACGTGTPLSVQGFTGAETREAGEDCQIAKVVWASNCWSSEASPAVGESVTIGGLPWFVTKATRAGCAVVLWLCKAVLECPDCLANVYRLSRGTASLEDCSEPLSELLVAESAPGTVCATEQRRQLVDDAEILLTTARICLDTVADVEAGDLVYCTPVTWRVERVITPCSAKCLLTFEAIREPWNIHLEEEV